MNYLIYYRVGGSIWSLQHDSKLGNYRWSLQHGSKLGNSASEVRRTLITFFCKTASTECYQKKVQGDDVD
jgi:hypothetical protein